MDAVCFVGALTGQDYAVQVGATKIRLVGWLAGPMKYVLCWVQNLLFFK